MTNEYNRELFYSKNSEIQQEYYELLINRVTHSSMSLEKDLGNPDSHHNAVRLRDNMLAFKLLIHSMPQKMTEKLLIQVADKINASSMYISNGYRKSGNVIADTNIPITPPEKISEALCNLIDKYYQEYQELDIFEKEAMFHIEFIKIHPFEDGNGRTGRLLLNYNLITQGVAPVVITNDLIEYYQSYIKNNDIEGMANLFRIQSRKEQQVIHILYGEQLTQNTIQTKPTR